MKRSNYCKFIRIATSLLSIYSNNISTTLESCRSAVPPCISSSPRSRKHTIVTNCANALRQWHFCLLLVVDLIAGLTTNRKDMSRRCSCHHRGYMLIMAVAVLLLSSSSTISAFTFKAFFGASSNDRGGCSRRRSSCSGRLDMSSTANPYEDHDDAIGAPVGPLPSVSSKINYGDQTPQNVCHDLWVVGSGTLGMLALKEWMSLYPDSKVIAETKTENRHAELTRLGVTPRLRSQRSDADERTARYLLICIPPSASDDYVAEIHSSCQLWAGPLGQGHMAFTSSTAVYGDSNGNTVDETFRLDTRSQRSTQ